MLLGRGLGLAAGGLAVVVVFSGDLEVTVKGLVLSLAVEDDSGRIAATEAARLTAYREVGATTDAWDAGRGMGCRGGLVEEFVRERAGVLGATDARSEQKVNKRDCLEMRMFAV